MLVGGSDGSLNLLIPSPDSETPSRPLHLATSTKAHKKPITSVSWVPSSSGLQCLSAGQDGLVKVWSVEESSAKKDTHGLKFKGMGGSSDSVFEGVSSVCVHPSATIFTATGTFRHLSLLLLMMTNTFLFYSTSLGMDDSEWVLQDLTTFTTLSKTTTTSRALTTQFHPDGLLLSVATSDAILLYDVKSLGIVSEFDHAEAVDVSFSENGYHFATASAGLVKFWDLRKGQVFYEMAVEGGDVGKIRFDASGKYVGVAHGSQLG